MATSPRDLNQPQLHEWRTRHIELSVWQDQYGNRHMYRSPQQILEACRCIQTMTWICQPLIPACKLCLYLPLSQGGTFPCLKELIQVTEVSQTVQSKSYFWMLQVFQNYIISSSVCCAHSDISLWLWIADRCPHPQPNCVMKLSHDTVSRQEVCGRQLFWSESA